MLRRTKMPALLVETGFINSEKDNQLFEKKFEEIARSIADAILGTLNEETVKNHYIIEYRQEHFETGKTQTGCCIS